MVDASASTRRSNTSARAPWTIGVVRCGERRELGEVTGETEVAVVGQRDRACGERSGAAGEVGELAGERGFGRGLEVRGVAVVPAAEEAPHVAHDELGLVVDRAEVRLARAGSAAR